MLPLTLTRELHHIVHIGSSEVSSGPLEKLTSATSGPMQDVDHVHVHQHEHEQYVHHHEPEIHDLVKTIPQ